MADDGDLWYAPILMQDHARDRIRERLGWHPDDPRALGEIRLGLLEGRHSSEQPDWAKGATERHRRSKERSRLYVWDKTATRCWVLARAPLSLRFVTVLLDRRHWRRAAEDGRLVRTGHVRR